MEKHGLRGTHALYLVMMLRHPEGITAPELCKLCSRDKSDVSRAMSIMEEKGLVVKEGGHQNRYRGVFKLTPAGEAAADQVGHKAVQAAAFAGKDLTEETREIFYDAMDSIAANLRDLHENGFPTTDAG